MAVLAAVAAFPVLTFFLIALSKAENGLYAASQSRTDRVAAEPALGEVAVD